MVELSVYAAPKKSLNEVASFDQRSEHEWDIMFLLPCMDDMGQVI